MEITQKQDLTEKQQFWLKHIEAAREQDIPLSKYAKENNLQLTSIYSWHKILKNKGVVACEKLEEQAFVRVVPGKACQHPSTVKIFFANHAQVELSIDGIGLANLLLLVKSL